MLTSCFIIVALALTQQPVQVESQPLGANIARLSKALVYLGNPWPESVATELDAAIQAEDADQLQRILDEHVLLTVSINPELRVKVERGAAAATIQQNGFSPFLIKVINDGTTTRALEIISPQSGPAYAGESEFILKRQAQTELSNKSQSVSRDRFLQLELFTNPPMTTSLSGLKVEYLIGLANSDQSGKREATIGFDLGSGNQDLGFRGETPVLFDVVPAIPVKLEIRDHDGSPTVARLTFRDLQGRVHPPQARRLSPDFFFQPQVYRSDGDTVSLPPGKFEMESTRGPEFKIEKRQIHVNPLVIEPISVSLKRWVNPAEHGYYSGDHHIHGAGCSHYSSPTQGVPPEDMFLQVKGEALNVGCVLTWGPCFDFQRQYFAPQAKTISEPFTILKYDLEISGFGSAALGHVCLLNLTDQTYPNSDGTMTKGWPTWTVPVMKWAKSQGGFTGYPHSAMHAIPKNAADRLMTICDQDNNGLVSVVESQAALLPGSFKELDRDESGFLERDELVTAHEHAINELPNLAIPEMDGAGAMEIFVSAAEGVCDFISAMDTARIPEWNTWYHLMNCGLPISLSGETDFPCMSSRRVGQGRVYVKLGKPQRVDFAEWCAGLAAGRSYVSDGYIHAFNFRVSTATGEMSEPGGDDLPLDKPATVTIQTEIQIAPETPAGVAYGTQQPPDGRAMTGDTVNLHLPRSEQMISGGMREIELVVNGRAIERTKIPADGNLHPVQFHTRIDRSSWIAIRQFPQLHTNPVRVLVDGQPIRASRNSALWCAAAIDQLWNNRKRFIVESEQPDARAAYDRAQTLYRRIATESPEGN